MGKDCDMCHHSSFKIFTARTILQCSRCGIRCHKQHYDDGEAIQSCRGKISFRINDNKILLMIVLIVLLNSSSTAKGLLVMCNSEDEQRQWIAKLMKKIHRQPRSSDELAR